MDQQGTLPEGLLAAFQAHIDQATSSMDPKQRCMYMAGHYAGIYIGNDDRDEFSSEQAISQLEECVQLNDGICSADIAELFADIYFERLSRLGMEVDAEKVEENLRIILAERPNDPESVFKLMRILHVRYMRTFSPARIEEALDLAQGTITALSDDHPQLPLLLGACGISLLDQSESRNSVDSLHMAIELFHAAEALFGDGLSRDWVIVRVNHAEALRRRFEVFGDQTDLDKALDVFEDIGDVLQFRAPDALEFAMVRMRILHARWRLNPNSQSLQTLRKEYAELQPVLLQNHRSPIGADLMQATGKALNETFFMSASRTGLGFTSVQSGLAFAQKLLRAWGQHGESTPGLAPYLFEMGLAYEQQYSAYFSPEALEKACDILMRCCRLTDPLSAPFGFRTALMVRTLRKLERIAVGRYRPLIQELGRIAIGSAVIRPLPMAIKAKAALAEELAALAVELFERDKDVSYLDRAISHFEKAVEMSSTDTQELVHSLHGLAKTLLRRGRERSAAAAQDYEAAVNALERIQELGRQKTFTFIDGYDTLGEIRAKQFEIDSDAKYANQAIDAWRIVYKSPNVSPVTKWAAAVNVSTIQERIIPLIHGDLNDAAESLADSVDATLEVISDSDTRAEQIWKIRIFAPLSSHAVSVGLLAGKLPEAMLRLLERGRALVWNRLLNRKADISTLKEKHGDLAERFLELQKMLPKENDEVKALEGLTFKETVESNRYHISDEYHKLLREIRQQPGFEDFMLPSGSSEELKRHASEGPVVTFVHSITCHAIILTTSRIESIHLPDFDRANCVGRLGDFDEFLRVRERDPARATEIIEGILTWLWTAAAEPVIDFIYKELGFDRKSPPAELPRIWWVCSGWINSLSIHAAGDHRRAIATGEPCTVMDTAVSSYTPTLQVLEYTRRTMDRMTSTPPEKPSAVLVGMKFTPDKSPDLDAAATEIKAVSNILSQLSYTVATLGNPSSIFMTLATRKAVVTALRTCTIALFACHGEASEEDPLKSLLCLQDWRKRPFDVGILMRMDFDNCQLVNLSACDVAVNRDMLLKEQGLHISGAFQMAGVPNTIATWWPVLDSQATRVSEGFYKGLLSDSGGLDVRKSARSLWRVLREMRDDGLSARVWGAYSHFGV
ncbi:hypothetical protein W97_03754 [Coniosporium apollinis CBS 100218]|uniref:CHAT domain-containing protein n=1 Tax=Coniosporium apollinis (strain CBS 100218) TaxID=1168221 RepID=R7YS91_CONA1|nr:uncharacterized protein W97_03754 [Coniosporium apollinis CBS 100218]EON64521.1 hypothetical protein W97_03754 [Coniosporium apollinis CBS 100218]